ncbi:hypothetical protein [Arthrobacter methylotrophus]|uniref:Uncharacterized protein n=1 Tax=Arthrobacter methylotrophus TaxID=121291 RepID=A0ABV5UJU7_9MICC
MQQPQVLSQANLQYIASGLNTSRPSLHFAMTITTPGLSEEAP